MSDPPINAGALSAADEVMNCDVLNCDVAGLGTILVDHQVFLGTFPAHDTKTEVNSDRFQVGGPVPTALVVLSRFGKTCQFVGRWGKDTFGELIEADLGRERVRFDAAVCARAKSSGFAHVWVDRATASRTIVFSRARAESDTAENKTAEIDTAEINTAEIDAKAFSQCRLLHLDGWSSGAAIKAAECVKRNGGKVFLDAGSPKPGLRDLLPLVDVVNAPQRFAEMFFATDDIDEAAHRLREMGCETVIFTHGADGAVLYNSDGRMEQPAFPVAAVDTTGAGDVFCGGFLYAILEDWSSAESLKFAAATAALKCTRIGNRAALPTKEDVLDLMNR
jgi:sugar/nucleoside kinase (ribokinase family)